MEITDYEKRFVSAYTTEIQGKVDPATGKRGPNWIKPGVLRRMYKVLLNNTQHPGVSGLEDIHLNGQVQISRCSRVFGLTFSGDTHAWRLKISTASGTEFTPRFPNGTYPMVSTLSPGSSWNNTATDMAGPDNLTINAIPTRQVAWTQLPMLIEPNWELDPNESLMFEGLPNSVTAIILEIGIHVWEFPGMIRGMEAPIVDMPARSGGGPAIMPATGKRC